MAEYPGDTQNPLVVTAEWCVGTSQSRVGVDEACSGAHQRFGCTTEHFVDAPVARRDAAKAFGGAAGYIFGAHARLGHIAGQLLEGCCSAAALTARQLSSPINRPPVFDRHLVVVRKVINAKTVA